ncbi:hypothetical protein BS50DRAFT_580341 [Corynespora cassiicola Philippines]|uniref:EthD domain-containing protein n=1 Tax=Corynespora cassiicola Philippines TaxID=1448308 RepID=A0A2T2N0I6_CORCC|nr:hypothetical protein BS50DRAFT_580341 [Corynespora cassiicola Philippines]
MGYTIFAIQTRKSELTPNQFMDYYDNVHIPILKECVGDAFPKKHSRYFVSRQPAEEGKEDKHVPVVFYCKPEEITYDVIAIMEFEDFEAFLRFHEAYDKNPRKAEMDADQASFVDFSKLKAVATEDPHVTER